MRRCGRCGFTFSGRRPGSSEITDYYDGYGTDVVESSLTRERYSAMLDRFEAHRQTGRILDVGCGEGAFLQVAAERGWSVHGTESTQGALARNRARGIEMTLAPTHLGDLPEQAFDVVTAFEVVEHVTDPRAEATLVAEAIRPGGLLYVTTPNFASASRRLLRSNWSVIAYPEHLGYFEVSTLARCFEDAGFTSLEATTTGVSPGRLRQGLRRGRSDGPGASRGGMPSSDEALRQRLEGRRALRAVKRTSDVVLGALRAGDTIKASFLRT